jgi:protein-tyrosine-phosphatase
MTKPAAPRRFLFVCTGNTCRSPMAQFLFARLAREKGLPWTAASAGVGAFPGAPLSGGAVTALAARGLSGLTHEARQVDAAMLAEADLVFGLAREHVETLKNRFPDAAKKVRLLREDAGLKPADVEDPVGEDARVYAETAAAIEEALIKILERESHAPHPR